MSGRREETGPAGVLLQGWDETAELELEDDVRESDDCLSVSLANIASGFAGGNCFSVVRETEMG